MRDVLAHVPVAREFFQVHLPPELKAQIDLNTLVLENTSFVDKRLNLQIADVLYSAQMKGAQGYLYLLTEHASTPSRWLAYRMQGYIREIQDFHLEKKRGKTLPLVFPLILYGGKHPFSSSRNLFDLYGPNKEAALSLATQDIMLVDLSTMPDTEIQKVYGLFRLAAMAAKHIRDENMLLIVDLLHDGAAFLEEQGFVNYTVTCLAYIAEASQISEKEALWEIAHLICPALEKESFMPNIAEKWKQEGL
jgi:predicted transposase YdaD